VSERRSSYERSLPGLLGAIAIALLLVVCVWGLTRFQHRDVPSPAPTIDYSAQLDEARASAPFDVLAPSPEPPGWRATSAAWDGVGPELSWHLGLLTSDSPDADYVGLEQGNAAPAEFLLDNTPADQPGEPIEIGGRTWEKLTSADGQEMALFLPGDHVTTLVTGTVPEDELVSFIESLSAH
jgi:hypothetical protein